MTSKTREQWLNQGMNKLKPVFKKAGFPLPDNIRITCGWPSKSAGRSSKRRIGECWDGAASEDNTIEVIVSMVLADPLEVMDVLTHELDHAAVGVKCGHKGAFKKCAVAIGLTGSSSMVTASAGPELTEKLEKIIKQIGPYPHATIDFDNRKKQTTRMVKVECNDAGCGMVFRTSNKWIEESAGQLSCPICQGETTIT
jgi:hypothetical protein